MRLRRATEADCVDLWRWRNDPVTRAMSRTSDEVDLAAHTAWFRGALLNPSITLLIGETDDGKVGMVRFDHRDETEVSINLNPAFRGQGLSMALLGQALESVAGAVFAEIKDENAASRRLFERAGFRRIGGGQGLGRYRRG
ncbi:MAG: GNAT family N-acetyltransferase [Phenylobacterium sp.]|uniref:GNAT family N-acetyltransferase n=1 Tax=Phenylobacterium sp. TaxID=1871053 RepID=UPI001A3DF23C|nr:GNAT family N-acetyltransferase [Phenylobacterium sp.]MBL8771318.1 GNAT family N-acetyltransferase [Phenylobacterium sp.]